MVKLINKIYNFLIFGIKIMGISYVIIFYYIYQHQYQLLKKFVFSNLKQYKELLMINQKWWVNMQNYFNMIYYLNLWLLQLMI